MTKPEPTPLPEPAGRLIGCHDDDLDGVHGYTAGQMRDAMSARDAAWQARCDALVADMEARKDAAYLERNRCVSLIARIALAMGWRAGIARTAIEGWSDDWHGCVYIDLPAGQVSWHYHDSQASLFNDLPQYAGEWDGHDTPEKYRRVGAPVAAQRTYTQAEVDALVAQAVAPTPAVRDVLAERRRQIEGEGWTAEHDDKHGNGSMAVAAACYVAWSLPSRQASETVAALWPWMGWARQWFKPKDERHNLIRAAALLLAEIERLDRVRTQGAAVMADLLTPLQAKIVAVLARKPMRCAEWNELGREIWPPSQHPRAWRYSSNGGPPGWAMSLSRACRQLQGMGIVFDRHYAQGQRDVKLSASGFAAWNRRTPPAGDAPTTKEQTP